VIDDADIWRAAGLMIKTHGGDAALVAAQRADALLAEGDVEGEQIWKRIADAISELQRTTPGEGESLN
jgi:hypothetical protein